MTVFETIGLAWTVLTSSFATFAFFYFAIKAIREALRQQVRGQVEEQLDSRRALNMRYEVEKAGQAR